MFQNFGPEVCYFVAADSEKKGSWDMNKVLDIGLKWGENGDPELHIHTVGGRVYLLRSPTQSMDELERAWALWNRWLSFVRRTPLPEPSSGTRPSVSSRPLSSPSSSSSSSRVASRKGESPRKLKKEEEEEEEEFGLGLVEFSLLSSLVPSLKLHWDVEGNAV